MNGIRDLSPVRPSLVSREVGAALHEYVTYRGMHARIVRLQGAASAHRCFYCTDPATGWAYDHADPQERLDPRGYYYSMDMDHYMPLCQLCHTYLDKRYLKLRRA